jgi:hypothetical protein
MDNTNKDIKIENKIKRCCICKKKIGLFEFNCKCGAITCAVHRYPSEHSCTIDYKQIARNKLRKENPVIYNKFPDKILKNLFNKI